MKEPTERDSVGHAGWRPINPQTDTIYVTSQGLQTVSVINGRSNAVAATIPVTGFATGVAVNPRTSIVCVTVFEPEGTVAVISARTNTIVATVPVGSFPFQVGTNPRTNTAYVTNAISNTVSVLGS